MDNRRHIHHYARHFGFSYPTSVRQRLYSILSPIIIVLAIFLVLKALSIFPFVTGGQFSFAYFGGALLRTLMRLAVAYALALVVSIPLALAVIKNPFAERILLPLYDIVQSVPVLAFFPVVIALFISVGFTNGAAIFIIFLTMLWNIVFSLVGGLKVIPQDIKDAAHVFKVKGSDFTKRVLLPAVVPYLVTGSLLAWAQAWNIIIVAEVLHTYIPGGTSAQDLFGIGSVMVQAAASGQNGTFIAAILTMVIAIAILNFFVWQKLLHYAERFKFE